MIGFQATPVLVKMSYCMSVLLVDAKPHHNTAMYQLCAYIIEYSAQNVYSA